MLPSDGGGLAEAVGDWTVGRGETWTKGESELAGQKCRRVVRNKKGVGCRMCFEEVPGFFDCRRGGERVK